MPGPERHRALVARAAPFALYMAVLIAGPALEALLDGVGLDPRWAYAVQVALPLAALAYLWPEYGELRPGSWPDYKGWLLATCAGVLVFALWINLDVRPLTLGQSESFDPRGADGRVRPDLAATRMLGAALVVPIMEELFWRSFVMRWLRKPRFLDVDPRTVGGVALVVSSALFAAEHHLWFAGLLAGLAYGWIYMRTGSLWVPIVAHAVTNALLGAWVLATARWTFW